MAEIVSDHDDAASANLLDIVARFGRHWLAGIIALVVGVGFAIFYLHIVAPRYVAQLVVTPADQPGNKSTTGLGGLGSLVGLDLSGQTNSAFSLYSDAVTSLPIAVRLSRDPRVMHGVFRDAWDPIARRWRQPESIMTTIVASAESLVGLPRPPWRVPDASDLKLSLERRIVVTEDKRRAAVTISFSDTDPRFAGFLIAQVNSAADEFLRQKALARASLYVTYLERRLAQIQVAEYRLTMAEVLGNYEKTKMLASSNASYAAEPFGWVWVSPVPASPKPVLVVATAVLGAIAVWVLYVIVLVPLIIRLQQRARDARN